MCEGGSFNFCFKDIFLFSSLCFVGILSAINYWLLDFVDWLVNATHLKWSEMKEREVLISGFLFFFYLFFFSDLFAHDVGRGSKIYFSFYYWTCAHFIEYWLSCEILWRLLTFRIEEFIVVVVLCRSIRKYSILDGMKFILSVHLYFPFLTRECWTPTQSKPNRQSPTF